MTKPCRLKCVVKRLDIIRINSHYIIMKIWLAFWAYWKWFCTALVTSTVILLAVATFVNAFRWHEPDYKNLIDSCIESGGAWDEESGRCKSSA